MKAQLWIITVVVVGATACAEPIQMASGIRTTCGSIVGAMTGSHDPTVVLSVPATRSFTVNVSSRREGELESLNGRLLSAKATLGASGAECTAATGDYRFDIRGGENDDVQLELVGVGPARVILEHDGHVLRSALIDLSAEQELRVTL